MDGRVDIAGMLRERRGAEVPLFICAPMVRYSKLAFRQLARRYGVDVAYTPMIVASSFNQSAKSRDNEFTTCASDRPLVVQFAASTADELATAAALVAHTADAVDANCGCPQSWAMAEGFGAHLIDHPELVSDMIRQVHARSDSLPVAIKIRIHDDLRRTVDLVQQLEHAGAAWLTVHGRTADERHSPVHYDAIRTLHDAVSIPLVANGDVFTRDDAIRVARDTHTEGVMAARGMLQNPAMFSADPQHHSATTPAVLRDWLHLSAAHATPFRIFHAHTMYMLQRATSTPHRSVFARLTTYAATVDYVKEKYL